MIEFYTGIGDKEVRTIVGKGVLEDVILSAKEKKLLVYPTSLKEYVNKLKSDAIKYEVQDGEGVKDLNRAMEIVEFMFSKGFDRGDTVIAMGGGTISDVVGFVASVYMRGLNLIIAPTTLLGMVDAAIGGKNGVNFKNVKNVIGTFYQPSTIVADIDFLSTLPRQELTRGMAEVIKYSIVLDKDFYDFLAMNQEKIMEGDQSAMEEVITRSIRNKLNIVSQDERETKGIRIVLNFGHTIGHAIEAGSSFSVHHGLAISVGMTCEAKISEEIGYSEEGIVEDVTWMLSSYGLPITIDELEGKIDVNLALSSISKDKKVRSGYLMMPLPTRLGQWRRVDIPLETLNGFAKQCLS
ncbi:3-dehydroquinate synthase [Sulfuracidifex metallicus]|uniref:3-dehydroquinate synthase n=1 Tax=Sulfuracidifex metallicus DSM 6482 = JCM 9184 TaxID=523847 RepID=A0A6A9QH61_SULME|nr:3-dehydroquinate synthase [Sulfuracidifex metallicus]MUN28346.1 3-dehydroquinate synthase [Sulfuracidifex metallicus DSM 6482 = JCM 9184]WOE51129.1 3-dehydroquinate synthase [Sulfuracidifex metallicus DSM 6482 = JCM 9184]